MQICMMRNANRHEWLAQAIAAERLKLRLSYADLARITKVDPSQVSRICRGEFQNLSENVLQICTALNITPDTAGPRSTQGPIEEILKLIGELSAEDADRLIRVLQAIRSLAAPAKPQS